MVAIRILALQSNSIVSLENKLHLMYAHVLILKCSGCDFYVIIHVYLSGVLSLSRLEIITFSKYPILEIQQAENMLFYLILF
jgi:hypothetical protein